MPDAKTPKVCKHCQTPTYSGPDGKLHHEKRTDPAAYGGRRADPAKPKTKLEPETPPVRAHPLHRVIGGPQA